MFPLRSEAVLNIIMWDALGPTGEEVTQDEKRNYRSLGLQTGIYWEGVGLVALPLAKCG